jgi:hypothetical protein
MRKNYRFLYKKSIFSIYDLFKIYTKSLYIKRRKKMRKLTITFILGILHTNTFYLMQLQILFVFNKKNQLYYNMRRNQDQENQ